MLLLCIAQTDMNIPFCVIYSRFSAMKEFNIQRRVFDTLKKYRTQCLAEVHLSNGITFSADESWIRAFQLVVKNTTDEEFDYIRENCRIYSGQKLHEIMILRRDGKFENEFEDGFYTANAEMAIDLL